MSKLRSISPRQAGTRIRPIDRLLDPAFFRALGDPTRIRLLACLAKCRRACSVTEIAECCSVDFSVVSRHLSLLARAGAVHSSKRGRTVFYAVQSEALSRRLRDLADAIDDCCPPETNYVCAADFGNQT
jgi:DNA-binding transcriptional ArsR family regulator